MSKLDIENAPDEIKAELDRMRAPLPKMTDTRDSFEKIAQELRERAETADMVLGRVGQYELKAYAGRIAALQAGAGDGDSL